MLVKHQQGFSLISIVLSIIIMSAALLIVTTSLVPRSQHNAELMYSTKASELGAAVMDEIVGRQFDQNSGPNGGLPVCGSTINPCTKPIDLGPDKKKRMKIKQHELSTTMLMTLMDYPAQ